MYASFAIIGFVAIALSRLDFISARTGTLDNETEHMIPNHRTRAVTSTRQVGERVIASYLSFGRTPTRGRRGLIRGKLTYWDNH